MHGCQRLLVLGESKWNCCQSQSNRGQLSLPDSGRVSWSMSSRYIEVVDVPDKLLIGGAIIENLRKMLLKRTC